MTGAAYGDGSAYGDGRDIGTIDGRPVPRGSRVRLNPGRTADVFDLALRGRIGIVDRVVEDTDGKVHVVVRLADDPGRDLAGRIGQRYFFGADEVEIVEEGRVATAGGILVAGVGDEFGPAKTFVRDILERLRSAPPVPGVTYAYFGIRLGDLQYAIEDGYETVVLIRTGDGERPAGTVSVRAVDGAGPPERMWAVTWEPTSEYGDRVPDCADEAFAAVESLLVDLTSGGAVGEKREWTQQVR